MTSSAPLPDPQPERRLLLVHAHPDDETLNNGVTMARYVAEGAAVTLVTCTLGEEGEVLVPELAHLAADADDNLGPTRLAELTAAMAALGVTDFVRLGGDFGFRDSGMAYNESRLAIPRDVLRDGIFWTTDLLEAANELVPVIRSRRPQVLVTYNEIGGYGHPDHIQAHRVAMYATQLAGASSYRKDLGEAWVVSRLLWATMSRTRMLEGVRALRASGDMETFKGFEEEGAAMPMLSDDADIAAVIDGAPWVARKIAAMRCYPTQIAQDGVFFAGADGLGTRMWASEDYRLIDGIAFPEGPRPAEDLFAGLS